MCYIMLRRFNKQTFLQNKIVTTDDKLTANKTVMFFIHGGSFTEGDGSDGFYGPDFIVDNDVVLVTFNYRLGPWGFANFNVKGYTGNMGFKDQQMALQWIHQNIRHFGGDPNGITVFGESAGNIRITRSPANFYAETLFYISQVVSQRICTCCPTNLENLWNVR